MIVVLRRLVVPVLVFFVWVPAAHAWSWPVQGPVLQPFLYDEAHPYAAGQHRGIDIGATAVGEQVVAPAAGTVSFAGTVPTSGTSLTIETADGYSVTLTHLGSVLVPKGAAVVEGAVVATIGPSGTPEVEGPYVHLGIRVTTDPNGYVDPLPLLPALTASDGSASGGSSSAAASGGGSADTGTPTPTQTTTTSTSGDDSGSTTSTSSQPATTSSTTVPRAHPRAGTRQAQGRSRQARPARPAAPAETAAPPTRVSRARSLAPERPALVEGARAARPPASPATTPSAPRAIPQMVGAPAQPLAAPARESRPQRPVGGSSALLPLVLNGAAALVAVAAALCVGLRRRRRRETEGAVEPPELRYLPQRTQSRRERCAA